MSTVSRFRPQIALGRLPVNVYNPLSFSYDLTLLTPANIIPVFMGLYIYMAGLNTVTFEAKFRDLNLITVAQPGPSVQNNAFDIGAPYVFVYLASLIPKNPTTSLTRFLRNKEIGLRRALTRIGLIPVAGNYVVPNLALVELQDFMSAHTNLMGHIFEVFLGYCNNDEQTQLLSYATELVGEMRYANMSSVQLIEDYLLTPNHPCLADRSVVSDIKKYETFRKGMIETWGEDDWVFSALLNKDKWLAYARTKSHLRLRIISGMFASDEHHTFDRLQVSGNAISFYKGTGFYGKIYNTYKLTAQGRIQGQNEFVSSRDAEEIQQRAARWEQDLNLNPN